MLDVLMYIFENYVHNGAEFTPDHDTLAVHLLKAGFSPEEVGRVFRWLEGIATLQATTQRLRPQGGYSVRLYAPEEAKKINLECQGFLLALEQAGVLAPQMRELIIERALAMDSYELTLDQLKWIVVLVLFHKPGQAAVMAKLEDTLQKSHVTLH